VSRIFCIDGNWYLHRLYHTLKTNLPLEVAIPYRLLTMVCKDALAVRADFVCVAFDGPKVFRYKLYENYKGDRNKASGVGDDAENAEAKDVYQYLPYIYDLFLKVGIFFHQPRKFEADDVLRSIATYAPEYSIVCGAYDKDDFQFLCEGVRLYNPSYKNPKTKETEPRYYTHEDVPKLFGVRADQMLDYQTLIGDKVDSIPPIKGMGPATARALLQKHGSLQKWWAQSKGDERIFIRTQMENLRRNRSLVELRADALPPSKPEEWKIQKIKPEDKHLPRAYHDYHAFVYPKSKGLFGRKR
jgi:DNA polymerase-1